MYRQWIILIVVGGQFTFMPPRGTGRKVDFGSTKLRAGLNIRRIKACTYFPENMTLWYLIWVLMGLVAERNAIPEACEVCRPVFLSVFNAFPLIFLTDFPALSYSVHSCFLKTRTERSL